MDLEFTRHYVLQWGVSVLQVQPTSVTHTLSPYCPSVGKAEGRVAGDKEGGQPPAGWLRA